MPDIGETHLVLWQNGTTTDLGTLGGLTATGVDINQKGQIVGTSDNGADDQWSHAFLWQSTTGMVDLGPWGGSNFGTAVAINNQSQVVGWGFTPDAWWRAFMWQSGTGMTDLGMLPNAISSRPNAINDQGQIVGVNLVATGDWHAVLWTIARPLTPAEQIAALTDAVNKLAAAGKLKRGSAQSLLTKLDNAARQLRIMVDAADRDPRPPAQPAHLADGIPRGAADALGDRANGGLGATGLRRSLCRPRLTRGRWNAAEPCQRPKDRRLVGGLLIELDQDVVGRRRGADAMHPGQLLCCAGVD